MKFEIGNMYNFHKEKSKDVHVDWFVLGILILKKIIVMMMTLQEHPAWTRITLVRFI